MRRYLLYISYIGTRFRGMQRQSRTKETELLKCGTVQELIEAALRSLKLVNEPSLVTASRTDGGVHALCNTAHVDLERPENVQPYDADFITFILNKAFASCNASVRAPFDVEKFCEVGALFEGIKDFLTFMKSPGYRKWELMKTEVTTVRYVEEVRIAPGTPLFSPEIDPLYENLDFWNISFKANAFLRNQIRRMVGAMIAAGQGKLTFEDVKYMLDNPSLQNWNSHAVLIPPHGLFLVSVEYDPESLVEKEQCP